MRFVVEVIFIGGGLPGFLGASSSTSLSVQSVVLRGAKNLQVNTSFGDSLTALVDFLAVCEILLEIHTLRLPVSRPGP